MAATVSPARLFSERSTPAPATVPLILLAALVSAFFTFFAVSTGGDGSSVGSQAGHFGHYLHYLHCHPRVIVDLEVYRAGARAFYSGDPLYSGSFTTSERTLPFTYPPFAALALGPLALGPFWLASVLHVVVSLAALVVATLILSKDLNRTAQGIALAIVLISEPVRATLSFGQVNTVLLVMVVLDWWFLAYQPPGSRSRRFLGVLTGIAAAIKLTPAIFILVPLLRKDFFSTLRLAGSALLCTGIAAVVAPRDSWQYVTSVLWSTDRIGDSALVTNQSLAGMFSRLTDGDRTNLLGISPSLWWFFGVAIILTAVVVIALRITPRRRTAAGGVASRDTDTLQHPRVFTPSSPKARNSSTPVGPTPCPASAAATPLVPAMVALAQLLCSPISWSHHWVWALPAVFYFFQWERRPRIAAWSGAIIIASGAIWWAPSAVSALPGLAGTLPGWLDLLVSNLYVWWAGLALAAVSFVPWKTLTLSRASA